MEKKHVMVCGVDCFPGAEHCNGYCTGTAPEPPAATAEQRLAWLRQDAFAKLREAEKAWAAFFAECPVGPDRTWAAEVFDRVRHAAAR